MAFTYDAKKMVMLVASTLSVLLLVLIVGKCMGYGNTYELYGNHGGKKKINTDDDDDDDDDDGDVTTVEKFDNNNKPKTALKKVSDKIKSLGFGSGKKPETFGCMLNNTDEDKKSTDYVGFNGDWTN